MKREDRLSAGMTPQKVSEIYAVLKARFEASRKKQREEDEKLRLVTERAPQCRQKTLLARKSNEMETT